MKAIVYTKYGSPDVLQLKEVAKPFPKEDEVLVRVHATSLNVGDFENLRGTWSARFGEPFRPHHKILGSDLPASRHHLPADSSRQRKDSARRQGSD